MARRPLLGLVVKFFLFYCFSFGLILFNRGIFADDWVLYNVDKALVIDLFNLASLVWFGYFHAFMFGLKHGILFYKIITFVTFLLVPVLFYRILLGCKFIDEFSREFLVLFFGLFPVYNARQICVVTTYNLLNLSFFLGFWLLDEYRKKKALYLRLLSLGFFAFSFFLQSNLVFFVLPIFLMFWHEREAHGPKAISSAFARDPGCQPGKIENASADVTVKHGRMPAVAFGEGGLSKVPRALARGVPSFIRRHIDFLLLPVAFFAIKSRYFETLGVLADYNEITAKNFFTAFTSLPKALVEGFWVPVFRSLSYLSWPVLLIVGLLFFLERDSKAAPDRKGLKNYGGMALLGVGALILALLPYLVVLKMPYIDGFNSRNQILVPFGAAFLLCGLLRGAMEALRFSPGLMRSVFNLFLILFALLNAAFCRDYQFDWYKQLSLMEHFAKSNEIRDHKTFFVEDQAPELNFGGRHPYYYEYSGMFKKVFGNERRFADHRRNVSRWWYYRTNISASYSLGEYRIGQPEYTITIRPGNLEKSAWRSLQLLYHETLKPERFAAEVPAFINMHLEKIERQRHDKTSRVSSAPAEG